MDVETMLDVMEDTGELWLENAKSLKEMAGDSPEWTARRAAGLALTQLAIELKEKLIEEESDE
jgi:hypothetical protein